MLDCAIVGHGAALNGGIMSLLIITYAIIVVFTISFAFLSFVWPVFAFLGRLAFIIGAVCSAFWAIVFGALFVVLSRRGFFDQFRDDPVTWHHTGARVLRVVLIICAAGCVVGLVCSLVGALYLSGFNYL